MATKDSNGGALGRGLGNLVNEAAGAQTPVAASRRDQHRGFRLLSTIRIDDLRLPAPPADDEFNRRLKESIREEGVLQPIIVQRTPGHYRLLAGRRRLKAARELGIGSIPAIVMNIDDEEAAKVVAAAHLTHLTDADTAHAAEEQKRIRAIEATRSKEQAAKKSEAAAATPPTPQTPVPSPKGNRSLKIAAAVVIMALSIDIAVRLDTRQPPDQSEPIGPTPKELPIRDPSVTGSKASGRPLASNSESPENRPDGSLELASLSPGLGGRREPDQPGIQTQAVVAVIGTLTGAIRMAASDVTNAATASVDTSSTDVAAFALLPIEKPPATGVVDTTIGDVPATTPPGPGVDRAAGNDDVSGVSIATPPPETLRPTSAWQAMETLAVEGVDVTRNGNRLDIVFSEAVFGEQVEMTANGRTNLTAIADTMAPFATQLLVRVTGHTDSAILPPNSPYRSHNELGLERARAAAQLLANVASLPQRQIIAVSRGRIDPPFPDKTEESSAKNRTVTIAIRPLRRR